MKTILDICQERVDDYGNEGLVIYKEIENLEVVVHLLKLKNYSKLPLSLLHKEVETDNFKHKLKDTDYLFNIVRLKGFKEEIKDGTKIMLDDVLSNCCSISGKLLSEDDFFYHKNKWYSKKVFTNHFSKCSKCGSWELKSTIFTYEGSLYCSQCKENDFRRCTHCNKWVHASSLCVNDNDEVFCAECFALFYFECARCGGVYLKTNAVDINGHLFCRRCSELDESFIFSWNYTPSNLNFFKINNENENNVLTLGIEIEVNNNEGKISNGAFAKEVSQNPLFYCKHDGSISYGVEVVSNPFTERYYKKNKKTMFDTLTTYRKKGFSSYHESCGIHIHLSKNSFTKVHLYKFLKFFYDKSNFDFILAISQRTLNKIKHWSKFEDDVSIVNKAKHKQSAEKYQAVNLRHKDTVEIRIFRGNLRKERILKNIEFVLSVFYFTKNNGMNDINLRNYMVFLQKNKKEYGNLLNFITEKEIVCV